MPLDDWCAVFCRQRRDCTPHPARACRAGAQLDAVSSVGNRKCTICGDDLPAAFFAKGGRKCRACKSAYDRWRREATPHVEPVAAKECGHCRQLLPAAEFDVRLLHPTGLNFRCRNCSRERSRQHLARNAAAPLPAAALPSTKTCTACKIDQPRAEYHESKGVRDGLQPICKACRSTRDRRRYAARKQP